ncbi:hypothetical protein [Stenotrophomonas sepilia]|uniref:hypothetical protein n=1 Tax=Stenotrophomonas sepilia TaxID=2860290 RepID=UPI0024BDDA25|nr:hypothetical protein [Stenotrophomonas sepilia]MDJ1623597.1 hypothetical protein [Stenotrophomonas sepilia]
MSPRVEFTGRCFGANLSLVQETHGDWSMSLYTFVGKDRKHRGIAFATAVPGQLPRVDPADGDTFPSAALWVGSASFDVPDALVPKLQAFLAEHTQGGAA